MLYVLTGCTAKCVGCWGSVCGGCGVGDPDSEPELPAAAHPGHHRHRLPHRHLLLLRLRDGHRHPLPLLPPGLRDKWWLKGKTLFHVKVCTLIFNKYRLIPKWLQETDENTWKEKCWRRRKEKQLSQRQASNSEWLYQQYLLTLIIMCI